MPENVCFSTLPGEQKWQKSGVKSHEKSKFHLKTGTKWCKVELLKLKVAESPVFHSLKLFKRVIGRAPSRKGRQTER
jgi:hypothetical protein